MFFSAKRETNFLCNTDELSEIKYSFKIEVGTIVEFNLSYGKAAENYRKNYRNS